MVTVTNKEIYNKLLDVEKHVIATNGRVKLNRWMASTALGLVMMLFGAALTSAGVLI